MKRPELILVAGCNAAGKSTFIRTRLNDFDGFEIFMTDVYKGRTKDLIKEALSQNKNVVVETVFNDESFKDIINYAKELGYDTSLIVLFLDNLQKSFNRAAIRGAKQNGITISEGNVKINFNESFKNVATYYFYFDKSTFIYTGIDGVNQLIMSFNKRKLVAYTSNSLEYPQKFAAYSFKKGAIG